ncbi:TlpA disulfide reductase family protein [Hymenobacter koreensis]|uniref:Thioredoxin domain-containing protein n=1 Tax=Hymenobacter koreensis TaxID=1084523 RepID=A0ABP8IUA4_9BACT
MKRVLLSGVLLLVGAVGALGQQVRVVKLPALQQLLARPSDTTYVVNFWATWCAPCVEELPNFEQLRTRHARDKVKVVLVSLDFASKLDTKVRPFVQRQGLRSTVWLLNETDQNAFIDKVDPSWSGALPFTLIFNNRQQRRQAFEKPLTLTELESALKLVKP